MTVTFSNLVRPLYSVSLDSIPSRELPSHGSIIIILKYATLHMQLHAFHFLVSLRIKVLSIQNIKIYLHTNLHFK